jgi:hypothetical protein
VKNSQKIKRIDALTSTQTKTTQTGTFDKGNINMILTKVKQGLCRHKVTRGITLVISTNKKIVRCKSCEAIFEMDSIQGGSK